MRRLSLAVVLAVAVVAVASAALSDIAGAWIGTVDTDRGAMSIGLNTKEENGALTGALKTGHGEWPLKSASEKDGLWTLSFEGTDGAAVLEARIVEGKLTGKWKSSMANGTFELVRPKRKPAGGVNAPSAVSR